MSSAARSVLLLLVATLSLLFATRAFAQAPDQPGLLRKAQAAEGAAQPKQALAIYRRALALNPSSRLARKIRARIGWLAARSEGDFRPLAAWMRIRERPTKQLSLDELRAFLKQAEGFPAGRVRRDSWALGANALLRRFKQPKEALAAYQRWAAEPNLDDAERQLASAGVALARARLGQLEGAIDQLSREGLRSRPEARFLRAQRVAYFGQIIASAVLLALILLTLSFGGWRGLQPALLRRALSPERLALAALVLLPPLLIIRLYEAQLAAPFAMVALACGAAVVFCSIGGQGIAASGATERRGKLMAVAGALGTIAAAFLALIHSGTLRDLMMAVGQHR